MPYKRNKKINNSSVLHTQVPKILVPIIICLAILFGAAVISIKYYLFYSVYDPAKLGIPTTTPVPYAYIATTPPPTPTPTPSYSKEYKSSRLGISFTYLSKVDYGAGANIFDNYFTKEIGNSIYLYRQMKIPTAFSGSDKEFLSTIAPKSDLIKLYWKNPKLTLQESIRQQILAGYSEKFCYIAPENPPNLRDEQSYETVQIVPNYPVNATYEQQREVELKCPIIPFRNGRHHFVMDPKNPNKFYYIQTQQGGLSSGLYGHGSWDDTLHIF